MQWEWNFAEYKNKPVLVIRVLLHVESPQPLGLINEGSLFALGQGLPLGPKPFGDLRVVHFRILLSHFSSLTPTPNHESIHGSLHTIGVVLIIRAVYFGTVHFHIVVVRGRGGGHVAG